jgi:hypothetical protein
MSPLTWSTTTWIGVYFLACVVAVVAFGAWLRWCALSEQDVYDEAARTGDWTKADELARREWDGER